MQFQTEKNRNDKSLEEMRMTYSGIVNKNGKKKISVTFEANGKKAEASLPDCKIETNQGFEEDEIVMLEKYLQMNQIEIIKKAKEITGLRSFFRK